MVEVADWQKRDLRLPPWAKVVEGSSPIAIEFDPAQGIPYWLELLGAPSAPDQYWIECANLCMRMDLQAALQGTEHQASTSSKVPVFKMLNRPEWALSKFPVGAGPKAALGGARVFAQAEDKAALVPTARNHYQRIRGFLPSL